MRLGNGSGVSMAQVLEESLCSPSIVNHTLPVSLKKYRPKSWDLAKLCLASVHQHTGIHLWYINKRKHPRPPDMSSLDCSLLVTYFFDFCIICPNRDAPFDPWTSNSALHYTTGSVFQKKREILGQQRCSSRLVPCATQLASPETPDEYIQENESTL